MGSTCTAADDDLTVANRTVVGTESFVGCETLTTGPGFVVAAGGEATLTAGRAVALGSGFQVANGGSLVVSVEPALARTASVRDDSPTSEVTYRFELFANLDGLTFGATDEIEHFGAFDAAGTARFRLLLRPGPEIVLAVRQDDGTVSETDGVPFPSGWNKVSVSWEASPSATASLSVNDGLPPSLFGLETETARIDFVRWGLLGGSLAGSSGTMLLDDFSSSR